MVIFTSKEINLHDQCHGTLVSLNYTPPQKIKWRAIAVPKEPVTIALPGEIDTIYLRSLLLNNTNLSHSETLPILISWRRFLLYKEHEEWEDYILYWCDVQQHYRSRPKTLHDRKFNFSTYYGHNCFCFLARFSGLSYHFVKYFDQKNNFKYHPYYIDQYFRPCPRHTHSPMLFSWNEVHEFCKIVFNGTLPQLTSKKQEKDFVHLIKDKYGLFPMKAAYIGLSLSGKGEVMSFFCIILYFGVSK